MRKSDVLEHVRMQDELQAQADFISMVNSAPEHEPESTFVRYGDSKVVAVQDRKGVFHPKYNKDDDDIKHLFETSSVYKETRGKRETEIDCSAKKATADEIRAILNNVFPAQVWREDGKIMRRTVSAHPASRSEIVRLQEKLDEAIKEHGIKPTGLSETRRKIFDSCFDELARQEIISCHPRGLLLLRIRDELRSSLEAYESLYLSNAAYGIRKAVRVATVSENLESEYSNLLDERQSLLKKIHIIREQLQAQAEKFRQVTTQSKKIFSDERESLRRQNQMLKMQLESMVSGNREIIIK